MQAIIAKKQMRAKPEYRNTVMVDVDIAYPQVTTAPSPSGAAISEYYKARATAYYDYATGKLFDMAVKDYIMGRKNNVPFHTYTAMMTYEVTYNQKDFLSIYTDVYEFTGGAHGNTVRYADTFSLKYGRKMALSDFFNGRGYQTVIFGSILAQISVQISRGTNDYFDDYQKNVFQYFSEKNFYLTPEGLTVFFPLYTIAPYSSGIVTFVIPYAEFGSDLKYSL